MQKLQSQGVHHITICRRRPADVDRLLGGRARDAVRVRAAQPRQRGGEPPLLRSGRRPPDHRLHRTRSARPTRAAPRPTPAACTTSRSRSRRRRSTRRWSGSTSAGSGTAASRIAASWTRSTSTTRSASRSSSRRTASSRRSASRTPRCCSRRTSSASRAATTTSPRSHLADAIEALVLRSRPSLSDDRSPKNPY